MDGESSENLKRGSEMNPIRCRVLLRRLKRTFLCRRLQDRVILLRWVKRLLNAIIQEHLNISTQIVGAQY